MTVEDLLPRLNSVRPTSRGYMARCPAHEDRHPSLSVSEGNRAILLKCWSGCNLQEITAAMGLRVKDLFFKTDLDPVARRKAQQQRDRHRRKQTKVTVAIGLTIDALREAGYFVRSRQGLDIAAWSDATLNDELDTLADAYSLLWAEEMEEWT